MADQVISTVETTAIIPEKWSSRYYDVLLAELPFNSLVTRDYEGEITDLGDLVNIPSVPEFDDAVILPEATRSDADALTISNQQLVINRRIVKDFIITKRAQLQSLPFVDKLQEMAVYAINKRIQAEIIDLIIPSASAPDHTIAFDSGTTYALADMLEGKELLDNQDVPASDRHQVMGSAQWNDIFAITGFTSSDFLLQGGPLQTGQLPPALLGFTPHMTTLVSNIVYQFHRSFMTMAAQQALNIEVFNLGVDGHRATRVNCDVLIGIQQLDDERVVQIG
jgi:hypothetical protein